MGPIQLRSRQTNISFKEEWQQKDSSALSLSLPLQLLQEDIDMAIKQQQHIQRQQKEDITTEDIDMAIKQQQHIQQQQKEDIITEDIDMAIKQQQHIQQQQPAKEDITLAIKQQNIQQQQLIQENIAMAI